MVSRGQTYGTAPYVKNAVTAEKILQSPGIYMLYTFNAPGRIWAASCSLGIGVTGGSGTAQVYARVYVTGAAGVGTLAIVEACVAGTTANDSNDDANQYPGLLVPAGAVVHLDVNNNVGLSGGVIRASGLVGVSVP